MAGACDPLERGRALREHIFTLCRAALRHRSPRLCDGDYDSYKRRLSSKRFLDDACNDLKVLKVTPALLSLIYRKSFGFMELVCLAQFELFFLLALVAADRGEVPERWTSLYPNTDFRLLPPQSGQDAYTATLITALGRMWRVKGTELVAEMEAERAHPPRPPPDPLLRQVLRPNRFTPPLPPSSVESDRYKRRRRRARQMPSKLRRAVGGSSGSSGSSEDGRSDDDDGTSTDGTTPADYRSSPCSSPGP